MRTLIILCLFSFILTSCNEENTASAETTPPVENTVNAIDEAIEKMEETATPIAEEATAIVENAVEEVKEEVADKKEEVKEKAEKLVEKVEKEIKKRSKISFPETTWNFGDIKDGEIVSHDFKFKNTGNAPLLIKNVTASCGCTQPSFPFLPIEPGEEGVIGVTFNSTGKINEQRPTVTVITNSRPSTHKLKLEGMVRPK